MNRFVVRVSSLAVAYVCLTAGLALTACSPTLNWREVRLEPGALVVMLPCKPDQGTRLVSLGGQNLSMHMLGCDVDSTTFAVSYVDLPDATQAAAVQTQWKAAMLGNMRATQNRESPFNIKGVVGVSDAVRLQAQGMQPDGRAVMAQGVWFVRGAQVFHAVMYASKLNPEAADAFFTGFRLQ
jgi:hypothetical protein